MQITRVRGAASVGTTGSGVAVTTTSWTTGVPATWTSWVTTTVLTTSVGVQAASAKAKSAKKLRAKKIDLRDIIFSSKENFVWFGFFLNQEYSCVHNYRYSR